LATEAATITRARVAAVPAWAWLVAIVAVSAVGRYVLGRGMVAPWIMVDELLYSELAKSFAATGHLDVRGVPEQGIGFVYPVLIAPAFRLASIPEAYAVAKTVNAVLMSLAAVPAYLLARRIVRRGLALLVAALTVAVPSMVYTGTLMTENAFYPLFLCVALALVSMLERPTWWNQVLVLALCGLAFLTRAQAVALVPAVLTATLLFDRKRLRSYAWLYGLIAGAVALVAAYQLARGRSVDAALGAYRAATDVHYDVATAFRWLVYHVAELDLYVGVAPFAAFLFLAFTLRGLSRRERAFVAAALPLTAWLVLEVAIFASAPSVSRIEERNMFYVAPLFFLALAVWIERGLLRPPLAAACAVVSAALVGAIPFAGLINENARSDTLSLLPFWTLQDTIVTLDQVTSVAVLGAVVVALLFLLVPARWALALPAVIGAWFAFALWAIETNDHGGIRDASQGALFGGISRPDRDWIDRTAGRDANVVFVWSGQKDKNTLWQTEFFNRSVGDVYNLSAANTPGNMPETKVTIDPRGGGLVGSRAAGYVLTDDSVRIAGTEVARDEVKGMILYRTRGPLRMAEWWVGDTLRRGPEAIRGVYADTWSGPAVTYTRRECDGGRLTVLLESDASLVGAPQVVQAGSRVVVVPAGGRARLTVPLRRAPGGTCGTRFTVSPTAVPGNGDTRRLGVHFTRIRFSP
jgi:dolichyl-phosphate-mannose-protein mannosyltransferase